MANVLSADVVDFSQYLKDTDTKQHIKKAGSYVQSLKDRLRTKVKQKVTRLPWSGTEKNFEFRRGEVSIWSGQNGHGKSLMTSQIALSIMGQGEKVCIASFEMKPVTTLQRMARNWIGINPFTPEFQGEEGIKSLDDLYDQFGEWTDGRLWLYDQNGMANPETIIGMARYCAKELGIDHIFIDNLAKVISREDDYNGQKNFIDMLTSIARDYGVHIHVVHHLKKPEKESSMPDKHDNKGTGAITDLADNIFLVWRNKLKEEDYRVSGQFGKMANDPDHLLMCRKQRNYEGSDEDEFTVKLWFNKDSQQYTGIPNSRSLEYWKQWPH